MSKIIVKLAFCIAMILSLSSEFTKLAKADDILQMTIPDDTITAEDNKNLITVPPEKPSANSVALSFTQHSPAFIKTVSTIWNYRIYTIDQHPITVRTVVLAIVLIFFGFWAARKLSYVFSMKLLLRFGLQRGEAAALQALVFYVLVIFFTLFTLQLVHIPLTVFTVLGGAIAIGIGFGSQNIMNNFISGIILLLERPIRIGDLVEVEGFQGRVQTIGARSTRILTHANIDIVVPNSVFLEKNVINWTLSDEKARGTITVSVEYSSDVEKVKELLLMAANQNLEIIHRIPPFAVLADFSDNAMTFKLYFWYSVNSPNNRLIIESDIRTAIAKIFKQNGISIPLPKRDMTLETSSPLEVKLITDL